MHFQKNIIMSLEDTVNSEIKKAMLAKDQKKLAAIRAIKSEILLLKTGKGKDGITPEMETATLQKMIKQRKESAEIYNSQNRADLAEEELSQAAVIETFMPALMSRDEVKAAVSEVIAETGATTIKDMGKVMGVATKKLAGKTDNKTISEIVKELLASQQ